MKLKILDFDVIVIGCGIAGMTAAIYLKRANLNVCIIEKNAPGGQLNMISDVSNYPGFTSIDGPSLAFNIYNQIKELNISYKYGDVLEIINDTDKKIVKTSNEELTCKGIIIATGRKPRELGLSNEKKLLGRGISYCSICDGTLYKDKEVCVVGGGNSALEGAIYLSDICKKVTLIHRKNELKGEQYLIDKLNSKSNIEILFNEEIKELIEQDDKLSAIKLKTGKTIQTEALFIYIGNIPVSIKCDNLKLENDYILVDSNMKTNINRIYACGDIINKDVYQLSTAVGEGSIAAMSLIKTL